jgi:hypothetical protein
MFGGKLGQEILAAPSQARRTVQFWLRSPETRPAQFLQGR